MNLRSERHPNLPPPALEIGVLGWLRANLFSSVWNTLLTLLGLLILYKTIPAFINWAFIDAVWLGDTRADCDCLLQGDVSGACWVFIKVRLGMFMYGFYPEAERWRVNYGLILLAIGALPLLLHALFTRRWVYPAYTAAVTGCILAAFGRGPAATTAAFLLAPVLLSPLSMGKFFPDMEKNEVTGVVSRGAALILAGAAGFAAGKILQGEIASWPMAWLAATLLAFSMVLNRTPRAMWNGALLVAAYPVIACFLFLGGAFGLPAVETHQWGGMFLTLVVAGIGMASSLPIGIFLALGRRSSMPVTRTLCIGFIELIRGVPLISVLFMASVMLPLFLPEGTHFNKLLRALIGVSLFYAAYMAEVVRGGLQAIPRGQYEASEALGLGYWKTMGLVILPQALRLVIPGIVNTFLGLFKDTTLVAIIGLMDMLGIVKTALADTDWLGFPKEAYVFAAFAFWVFCFSISRYSMHLEKRLDVGRR